MDFSNAVADFIADLELEGRQPGTVKKHSDELARLALWLDDSGYDWQTLTRKELQGYVRPRAKLAASTKANMFSSLRVFFRWGVEMGYVAMSPAAGFKTPRRPRALPKALTIEQIKALITYLRNQEGQRARRDETLIIVALYSGLRAAELAGLRWPAVDFAGECINIRLSKMNKGRAVPLHTVAAAALSSWRDLQSTSDQAAPVFSLDGKALRPNRIGKICRRVAKETGLPLTAHVLRHTFATWALRRSHDVYAVSKALGHSELRQTEVYIAGDVADALPAVDALPDLNSW
jgi:site-specific recombinase XerC